MYAAEVITVPCSSFGLEAKKGVLRLALTVQPHTLTEAAKRMAHAVKVLKESN